jgi:hypothetical protein
VIDLRSSQEVERAARTTGCGPHRSRARRGPRDRESCRLCGRFVDLYSLRAEDPNRVGGTRDALPTFVLLDDRRRSRGGWLIEIPRHQRTFPRTEQERGVWTPSPFPRLAAAPSSPQRRMCREAPSGRTAARTGLRAKSGRNVRSSGSSALTERRQGFRTAPLGREPFVVGVARHRSTHFRVVVRRELPVLSPFSNRGASPTRVSAASCSNPLC